MIAFLISLANADIFIRLFKNKLNKAEVRIVLGLAIFLFFLAFGITCDSVENKNNSEPTVNQKVATDVKEQSNQEEPTKPAEQSVEQEEITLNILQPEDNTQVKTNKIEINGNVSPKDASVSIDGNNKAIGVDIDGSFSFLIDLSVGENKFNIIAKKDDLRAEKEISITRNLTAEEIRKQFKTESKSISYKELFRNIDDYKDTKIYFTAKVNQVIGDGNFASTLKIYMTRGAYDIWDDEALVTVLDINAPKILEGDVIKIWGIVEGETSYQTVLGAARTVPDINAEIIELSK